MTLTEDVRKRALSIYREQDFIRLNLASCDRFLEPLREVGPQPAISRPLSSHDTAVFHELLFGCINYCFVDVRTGCRISSVSSDGSRLFGTFAVRRSLEEYVQDVVRASDVLDIEESEWTRHVAATIDGDVYDVHGRFRKMRRFAEFMSCEPMPERSTDAMEWLVYLYRSDCFNDPFLKRAQATVAAVDGLRFSFPVRARLEGFENFTCFADYRLPQVLMHYGILKVSSSALALIEARPSTLSARDPIVVCLRAATIVACAELALRFHTTEANIDRLLWQTSQRLLQQSLLDTPQMLVATDHF